MATTVLAGAAPITAPAQIDTVAELWNALNSAFFIALFSTFISAFAGTWGAQLLAERTSRRKELLHEIRGTNAALGFAFNIANTYITTKKQHIKELVSTYKVQEADFSLHSQGVKAGTISIDTAFEFKLELKTILPPFSPIEGLQKALVDRITPDINTLIMLTPLTQCIQGFADTVSQRNTWINELRELPENKDELKAYLYFGAPYAEGRVDDRYPCLMRAIECQTDDCIAFSILIVESLKNYGDKLAAQYGRNAPKIAKPDFTKAGDLIPDMGGYPEWSSNS